MPNTPHPTPITPEELVWVQSQPVVGRPGMNRLTAALEAAGLKPVELVMHDEGERVNFNLVRIDAVRRLDSEQTLRRLIAIFRGAGFDVGLSEVGIADFDQQTLFGSTLTGPVNEICEQGGIKIDP